jgi:hypothetical protein
METARRDASRWLDTEASGSAELDEFRRTWAERFGLIAVG